MKPDHSGLLARVGRCATMSDMNDREPSKDGVGSTISVRLDSRTDSRLAALAEWFTEKDELGREVTASQIVRRAIDEMYIKHLTLEGND